MKVGDDDGKRYRRIFLKRDHIQEKMDKYGWIVLLLTAAYLSGHLVYAFFIM